MISVWDICIWGCHGCHNKYLPETSSLSKHQKHRPYQTINLSIQTFSTLNDRNPSKPVAISCYIYMYIVYIYDIFMLNRYSTCRLLNATYRTTYNDSVPDTLTNKWLTYRLPAEEKYWLWPKCWEKLWLSPFQPISPSISISGMEAIVVFLERWYLRKQVNSWIVELEVRATPPPKKWLFNAENDDLLLFVGEVPCFCSAKLYSRAHWKTRNMITIWESCVYVDARPKYSRWLLSIQKKSAQQPIVIIWNYKL